MGNDHRCNHPSITAIKKLTYLYKKQVTRLWRVTCFLNAMEPKNQYPPATALAPAGVIKYQTLPTPSPFVSPGC